MMTIAEQWEQQGISKGIEKGIPAGEVLLLRQLLTWRFGELPAWVEERLANPDQVRIEIWARRVLDAPSLEAVFGE